MYRYWLSFLLVGLMLLLAVGGGIAAEPAGPPASNRQAPGENIPGSVLPQTGRTTISVTTVTIPTHPVDNALVYHLNPTFNMYYAQLDRGRYDSGRIENRVYNLIILENDYLKLSVLPELGGRIYQAIFKPTGNNIFYQNPVLKPSPWGPPEMGWWLAVGGMEWGLPVEEHGYEWGIPWQYQLTDLPDGAMVEVWDTTAADRLRAKVAISLPDDDAFFQVTPTLENPTGQPIDYKFWLNAMLAPGPTNRVNENLRFIMDADQVTVHSTGDSRLPGAGAAAGWPIHNAVDWSRLGNWREWYGFFQRPRAAGDFQAVYDENYDEGVVRTYQSDIAQGAKFFGFGYGPNALSPDLYTDGDTSYIEMHGGVGPTFADTRRLEPHASLSWDERWYPVAGLGSLTWANRHLALYLEKTGDGTRVHLAVTRPRNNVQLLVLRRATNEVLSQIDLADIRPGQPYHSSLLQLGNLEPEAIAVVIYQGDTLLGAYQYNGGPILTPTPGPSPTSTAAPVWQGQLLGTQSIGGWSCVARIWVRNQVGLPVTIASEVGGWRTVGYVGTKPEYGIDALEFAPLSPGVYLITPDKLDTSFRLDLKPGTLAEVLFAQVDGVLPTPTPTPGPSASATRTSTPTTTPSPPTQTPSPTITSSPLPTFTPAPIVTPTPASMLEWQGRVERVVPITGWAGVVRIWVDGQRNIPVTIKSVHPRWQWQATAYTGSKLEYGPDALEFAPLPPISYLLTVPDLSTQFEFTLASGSITEVVFERTTPTATPTPVPTSTSTPTPTQTPTPTPTPTSVVNLTVEPIPTTLTLTPVATTQATASLTPTATDTPTPTSTPTPTPSPTPTPQPTWHVRVPSNVTIPGNWFAVIRVSVEGKLRMPVRITIVTDDQNPWSTTCLTGAKPEYGPYFCEFAPLIPAQYLISPEGLDIATTVEVGRGGVAVVIFEEY